MRRQEVRLQEGLLGARLEWLLGGGAAASGAAVGAAGGGMSGAGSVVPRPVASVALRLGDAQITVPVSGTREEIAAAQRATPPVSAPPRERSAWEPVDLGVVAQRCSLKARACEAAAKRALATTPDERRRAQERVDELIPAAKALPDCFLWMFSTDYRVTPADLGVMRPCFENLALACGVVTRTPKKDVAEYKEAVTLLAEAQSALRKALQDGWITTPDRDQNDVFFWLRNATQTERIFVERHMKLDDPADPKQWEGLRGRLQELDRKSRAGDNRSREAKKALTKLRFHAAKIANAPTEDHEHDWKVVQESAAKLGEYGIVPGDDRLSDALEDVLRVPEAKWGVPEEGRGVLRAVRELTEAESEGEAGGSKAQAARTESAAVKRVREWLRGRRAVLIGGERYPHAAARIQRDFGLAELHWLELTEHGRTAPIHPPIADPETAVVWAVIRLTGHLFMDEAAEACRTYGRPLVRLPGGYNPSQIAEQTIAQASGAFGA
ncbi:MAG: hypothetical protein ACKVW3_01270 [Phycisphaerales bacterium]